MILFPEKYKGIHPGIVLNRELKKRSIKQRAFALQIGEHPQSFNAIIKGKRNMPISVALKIENELNLNEGDFVLLQTFYNIKREKEKLEHIMPNISNIRKILFWDTDFSKIDWSNNYKAIIKRIFERGNDKEKNEIIRFYGNEKIAEALNSPSTLPMTLYLE